METRVRGGGRKGVYIERRLAGKGAVTGGKGSGNPSGMAPAPAGQFFGARASALARAEPGREGTEESGVSPEPGCG